MISVCFCLRLKDKWNRRKLIRFLFLLKRSSEKNPLVAPPFWIFGYVYDVFFYLDKNYSFVFSFYYEIELITWHVDVDILNIFA